VQVGVNPDGIGSAWLAAITASPDWTLAGVVDTDPGHRALAAESTGLSTGQCFETIDDAVRAVECVALALVVPSPLHEQLCRQALGAGQHVVIEKPFTLDVASARGLVDLAGTRGLVLAVNQNYRYLRVMRALRRLVRASTIGTIDSVAVSFDVSWPGRPYQWSMAHPMLYEMAIHHLDALRDVLGTEALTASGHTWRPRWTRYAGDTVVACSFEFEGSVEAIYRGSLDSPGRPTPWPGVWRIEGERGALHLDDLGAGYGLYVTRGPDTVERVEPDGDGYDDQGAAVAGTLHELATALREGRRPQSDGRDNLRTLAMASAVACSSAEGRIVDITAEFFPLM